MQCYKCQNSVDVEGQPGRNETCPKCSAYLHCCLNCRFYDSAAHNQCREPQAEWVKDKEMGNFCDFFKASQGGKSPGSAKKDEALKKLNALFKKK